MKLPLLTTALLLVLWGGVLQGADEPQEKPSDVALETTRDRVSYGIGRSVGENIKSDGLNLDVQLIARGIADVLASKASPQTQEEFEKAFVEIQKELQNKIAAAGKEFFQKNGKKNGVTTTKSGLQYEVLQAATGKKPTAKDSVKAHYKGTFLDGKVFDSSYERKEPSVFPLDRVIKGWTEGLQLMAVGSKFRFWVPSDLAYGPNGRPGIPPNSLLVFEVELLDVIPSESAEPPAKPAPKK